MSLPTGLFTGFTHPFSATIKRHVQGRKIDQAYNVRRCAESNNSRPNTGQLWPRY